MFIARAAMCGLTYVTVAALYSSCSLQNISNGDQQLWMKLDDQWVMKKTTITEVELHTYHLYLHYLLFMHNKLQYTWRGDYCERLRPAQCPVITWGSSSVPPGTTSTIRSPTGPRRMQQCFVFNRSLQRREFCPISPVASKRWSRCHSGENLKVRRFKCKRHFVRGDK
jgi:hypothetical protein